MPQLQRYGNDGLELFIDQADGSVWASQSALGRMIDKDGIYVRRHEKTLSKGGTNYPTKTAETLTPGGIQGGTLYGEDFIFSLFEKYKPELLVQCAKAGLRVYLYGVAGYEVKAQRRAIADKSVTEYEGLLKLAPWVLDNPIIKAAFEQRLAEELGANNALPGVNQDMNKPVVVTVLAAELGFSLKPGQDSALGKWVRNHHEPLGQAQHGRYRVNVYDPNEIKDTVIEWFAARDAISNMTQSRLTQ